MKKIYGLSVLGLLLFACNVEKTKSLEAIMESNDLQKIRIKRVEIVAKQQEISEKLKQLDAKIAILDTTKNVPLVTTFIVKKEVFKHYLELQGNVSTKNNLVLFP